MSLRSNAARRQFEQPIRDNGNPELVVTRGKSGGAYDLATGTVTGGAPATQTIVGYIGQRVTDQRSDAATMRSRRVLLLPLKADGQPLTFTPAVGDTVTDGGETVTLEAVRQVKSGSTLLGFSAQGSV